LFAHEIESGKVQRVLEKYPREPLPILAVHAAGRRLATKVRVLIDFLTEIVAEEPSLSLGPTPTRR